MVIFSHRVHQEASPRNFTAPVKESFAFGRICSVASRQLYLREKSVVWEEKLLASDDSEALSD